MPKADSRWLDPVKLELESRGLPTGRIHPYKGLGNNVRLALKKERKRINEAAKVDENQRATFKQAFCFTSTRPYDEKGQPDFSNIENSISSEFDYVVGAVYHDNNNQPHLVVEYEIRCGPRLCGQLPCPHKYIAWGGRPPPGWTVGEGWQNEHNKNPFQLDTPDSQSKMYYLYNEQTNTMYPNPDYEQWVLDREVATLKEGFYGLKPRRLRFCEDGRIEEVLPDPPAQFTLPLPAIPEEEK